MKEALKAESYHGIHVRLTTGASDGPNAIIRNTIIDDIVGYSGYHEANVVVIGGRKFVFDGLFPRGIPYEQWRNSFEAFVDITEQVVEVY